ncbi:amidase family protein [Streptomyces sp. NRRL F-5135]|uniref:amidase family protein n=1 Tax=Streptomyces sp. NRRL F-5135 TaxID=1463858 RepID=UPI00056B3E99|nr:amidase [Streptomyces sp. NRRL F-5135]
MAATDDVERALARIERLDPRLCAFIEVWGDRARARTRAVARARTPEHARTVDGELPLAGLPFAVKGPSGIRSYAAGRLMAAGAVPVGSTAVPGPGTYWQTWGQGRHGRTVNPYRADRTPGGSSAGSAVAVAADMVPLATGSDGAGSVRIPAAWCGVFGLKTTNGLLPSPDRTGLAAAGVLARTVTDARAYLRCVLGPDGASDASGTSIAPMTTGSAAASAARASAADVLTPPQGRLPIPAVFSPDLGFAAPDEDVVAVVRAAVARLEEAGVVRLERPGATPRPFTLLDPREAWLTLRGGGDAAARAAAEDVRTENDRRLDVLFTRTPLLLTPVTPNRPHGHEGPGERYSTALTWAFNVSGQPAASIPAGFTADGCPVGLQLVTQRGTDVALLDMALAVEAGLAAARPTGRT